MIMRLKTYLEERYNNYFLITLLTYILPVVIFGNVNRYNFIFIPISIIFFWIISNWRILDKNQTKRNITGLINSCFFGFSLGLFGISVLGISAQTPTIKVSIYLGGAICIVSIMLFNLFIDKYRDKVKSDYESNFPDEKSKERDLKIKSILGNF